MFDAVAASLGDLPAQGKGGARDGNAIVAAGRVFADGAVTPSQFRSTAEQRNVFLEEVYSNYAELQKQMDELHDRKRKMDYDMFHSNNREIHDLLFGDAEVQEGRLGDWDTWDRVEGIVRQFAYGRSHGTAADFKEISALRERVEQLHHVVLTQRRQISILDEGMQPMQEELSGLVKLLDMKNREIRSLTSKNNTQTLQLRHMERECASLKSVGARHRVDEDQLYLDFKLLIEANKALERENAELRARLHANFIIPQRRSDAQAEDAHFLQFDVQGDTTDLQSMHSVFRDDDKRMEYVEAQIPISAAIMHMKRAKLAWMGRTEFEVASALCHLDYDANTYTSPQTSSSLDNLPPFDANTRFGGTVFATDPFTSYFGYSNAATVNLPTRPVATVIASTQSHRRRRAGQSMTHTDQHSTPQTQTGNVAGDAGVAAGYPPYQVPPPGGCAVTEVQCDLQSPTLIAARVGGVTDIVKRPHDSCGGEYTARDGKTVVSQTATDRKDTVSNTAPMWRMLRDCLDDVVIHSRAACLRRETLHVDTLRQHVARLQWQLHEMCNAVKVTPTVFAQLSEEGQKRVLRVLARQDAGLNVSQHAMRQCAAACIAACEQTGSVMDMAHNVSEDEDALPESRCNNMYTAAKLQATHSPLFASAHTVAARHVAMMYVPVGSLANGRSDEYQPRLTASARRRGKALSLPILSQSQSTRDASDVMSHSDAGSGILPDQPSRAATKQPGIGAETCVQVGAIDSSLPSVGSPDRARQESTVYNREDALRTNALQSTQIFSAVWDMERSITANPMTTPGRGMYSGQSAMPYDEDGGEAMVAVPKARIRGGHCSGLGWSETVGTLRQDLEQVRSANARMHHEMTDLFTVLRELVAFSTMVMQSARRGSMNAEVTRATSLYDQVSRELVESAVQRRVLSMLETEYGIHFTDPSDVCGGACDDVQWVVRKLRSAALELATEMVCNEFAEEGAPSGGARRGNKMEAGPAASARSKPPATPQPRLRSRETQGDASLPLDHIVHQSAVAFRQDAQQFLQGAGAWWPTGAPVQGTLLGRTTQPLSPAAGRVSPTLSFPSTLLNAPKPSVSALDLSSQMSDRKANSHSVEQNAMEWLNDPLLVRNFVVLGHPLGEGALNREVHKATHFSNAPAHGNLNGTHSQPYGHLRSSTNNTATSQPPVSNEVHNILQLLRSLRPRVTSDVREMQPTVLRYDIQADINAVRAGASRRVDAAIQCLLGANFNDFVKGYILPIAAMAKKIADEHHLKPALQLAVRQLRAEEERRRRRNVRLLFMRVLTTFRSRRLLRTAPYHGEAFPAFVCLLYSRWRRELERQRMTLAQGTREETTRLFALLNLAPAPPYRRVRATSKSRQLPPVRASGRYQGMLLRPNDASSFHFDDVALPK